MNQEEIFLKTCDHYLQSILLLYDFFFIRIIFLFQFDIFWYIYSDTFHSYFILIEMYGYGPWWKQR